MVGRVRRYLDLLRTLAADIGEIKDELVGPLRADVNSLKDEVARIIGALQLVYDEEPANRRRLHDVRQTIEYELAYAEEDPLVSVVIPTFDRHETLATRAVPSALGQTYSNIEVVVMGENSPAETAESLSQIDDPRLRFCNLNRRGPYPEGTYAAWLVSGTVPFNEAVRTARGRWIAPLDDDDAFRPHHVETLLQAARAARWEVVMGLQQAHPPEGPPYVIGEFPPRLRQFNLQATIYHAELRFIELELAASLFNEPNDWNLCRRWLRAGARIGLVKDITVDIYPSWRWSGEDRNAPKQGTRSDQSTAAPAPGP